MAEKPTYDELKQKVSSLEQETAALKRIKEALTQSEKNLARALDANEAGYYEHSVDNLTGCYFSQKWAEILGYKIEELPSRHKPFPWSWWEERLHPDHRQAILQAYDDFIAGRTDIFKAEFLVRHKSGEWRWIKARAKAVERDEKGRAIAVAATNEDITDHKNMIKSLRASEERYRDLVDHANDLIQAVKSDGSFLYVNRAWRETLGYSEAEVATLSIYDIVHPGNQAKCNKIFQCIADDQRIPKVELALDTKDGREIIVEGNVSCKVVDNEPVFSRAIFRDITKRKKAEKILRKAFEVLENRVKKRTAELASTNTKLQQEIEERKHAEETLRSFAADLEQRNRDLQDFTHTVSHDLQEPLMLIRTFSDRLCVKCNDLLTEQGREYLNRINKASRQMQNLIEGLLKYSRVTTKARPFVAVDLDQVVSEVISDLEMRIEQTGGRIEVGKLNVIEADPLQMHQLLQNLISNALKFHHPGEKPCVKIFSSLPGKKENHDRRISICVQDNGIGFEKKYADRIFSLFQRLQSHHKYEGAGIGLSICKKIVERHSGSISAESGRGQGAKFIINLPLKQK